MASNSTADPLDHTPQVWPLEYRISATVLHGLIFALGVVGNVLVVIVVYRKKSMHVPTYCYLVSLAVADLLVILASLPEAIVSYQLYANQWILGQAGCSLMAFFSFLGINASSLSISAFTVERFIAICHPLRAKSICTLHRARKIITGLWLVALASAIPWLGLTVIKPHSSGYRDLVTCSFRISPDKYSYLFGCDLLMFYIVPLVTSTILYSKIGKVLRKSSQSESVLPRSLRRHSGSVTSSRSVPSFRLRAGGVDSGAGACLERKKSNAGVTTTRHAQVPESEPAKRSSALKVVSLRQSRIKVIRMLIVIVILFAVLWLPYRGIMLYNCFSRRPYYNKWVMLFAKTCIFLNSSINPILYNAMSKRFRQASRDVLSRLYKCDHEKQPEHSTTIRTCQSSSSFRIYGVSPCPSPSPSYSRETGTRDVPWEAVRLVKSKTSNHEISHSMVHLDRDDNSTVQMGLERGRSMTFLAAPETVTQNGRPESPCLSHFLKVQ